ncbi:M20/M25/M40 family metallo-hydrolase [Sphingopyxis sp. LARHCG72]
MKRLSLALLGAAAFSVSTAAQEIPQVVRDALETEGSANSKIMWLMHNISDVHGSRLTGSPQSRRGLQWAVETFRSWGLERPRLEPWEFGFPGWSNQLVELSVTAPYQAPILARALPWTPSTKGLVNAPVILLAPPGMPPASRARAQNPAARAKAGQADPLPAPLGGAEDAEYVLPTAAELQAYLAPRKSKVRGAIVLVGPPAVPLRNFKPILLRTPDSEWAATFAPRDANQKPATSATSPSSSGEKPRLTLHEVHEQISAFLTENGALLRIVDSADARGVLKVETASGYNLAAQLPAVMISNADYGRMARLIDSGTPVTVRANVQSSFHPDGHVAHNALAEIEGTDKRDEVVMLGAHFDSWEGGTGAIDNGTGSAIMMEAVRLLKSLKVKPRRTIRVALWTGEEQGVFGSQAYVAQHFGSFENPKPDYAKLAAYVNIDTGTGRPRGATVFGPPGAAAFVATAMEPYRKWGFTGAMSSSVRKVGGADTGAFYAAGLPGIGLYQDWLDYSTSRHSNYDTYEEAYEPDLRVAAVEVAALVYALANDEKMLPRFSPATMPPPSAAEEEIERLKPARAPAR